MHEEGWADLGKSECLNALIVEVLHDKRMKS